MENNGANLGNPVFETHEPKIDYELLDIHFPIPDSDDKRKLFGVEIVPDSSMEEFYEISLYETEESINKTCIQDWDPNDPELKKIDINTLSEEKKIGRTT